MNPSINDILSGYNTRIANLTQQLVLAEAQIQAFERRLAELEGDIEEDA